MVRYIIVRTMIITIIILTTFAKRTREHSTTEKKTHERLNAMCHEQSVILLLCDHIILPHQKKTAI